VRFATPEFLLLFLLFIPVVIWQFKKQRFTTIKYSNVDRIRELGTLKSRLLSQLIPILRYTALALMILALARPQGINVEKNIETEGIDILLALDVSGSMNAEDFKPANRLTVAKSTVQKFVSKRENDRIGLVIFARDAYTACPLTLDYTILNRFVNNVQIGDAGDGTAIGMAIATSLNRLKNSPAKSKIIILLTDGENNAGEIDPISAAELAKTLGVKIYTIGVGKEGGAPHSN